MAEPIRVSVFFDAQNVASVRRGGEALDQLATRIGRLAQSQRTLGQAARAIADDVNRSAQQMYRFSHPAVGAVNRVFDELYGTLGRLARFGFYKLTADLVAVGYAFGKVAREFVHINEQFASLEITLTSVFKSSMVAKKLREELVRITAVSPIPFEQLANATRSFSVIPQFSGRIAQQALIPQGQAGALSDPSGFYRRLMLLVEQMVTFRPDKQVKDVVFSLREAATGELRSLIRRFDFPPGLLVSASGRSIADLKKDPVGMTEAIQAAIGRIISPNAIRQQARQPSVLAKQIYEQGFQIPLLNIGDQGLYKTMVDYFGDVYDKLSSFSSSQFEKVYAPRFSAVLTRVFFSLSNTTGKLIDSLLGSIGPGFDSSSRPGESVFQRTAEATLNLTERIGEKLPGYVSQIVEFTAQVLPAFIKATKMLAEVLSFAITTFAKHPIMSVLGYSGLRALPSLFGSGLSLLTERGLAAAGNARVAATSRYALGAGGTVAGSGAVPISGTVGYLQSLRGAPSAAQPTLFSRAGSAVAGLLPGSVQGPSAANLAWLSRVSGYADPAAHKAGILAGIPGYGPQQPLLPPPTNPWMSASVAAQNARITAHNDRMQRLERVAEWRARRETTQYTPRYQAAMTAAMRSETYAGFRTQLTAPGTGVANRLGALAGVAAGSVGLGAGGMSAIAGGTAGLAAMLGPIIVAVAATAAIGYVADRVMTHLETKRSAKLQEQLNSLGLGSDDDRLRFRADQRESSDYASQVRAGLITAGATGMTLRGAAALNRADLEGMAPNERAFILGQTTETAQRLAGMNSVAVPSIIGDPSAAQRRQPGMRAGQSMYSYGSDGSAKGGLIYNNFSLGSKNVSDMSVLDFVQLDSRIKADMVALLGIIEGKGQLDGQYVLKSIANAAMNMNDTDSAKRALESLKRLNDANASIRYAVSDFTGANLGVSPQPSLNPEQMAATRMFEQVRDVFVTGKENPDAFYTDMLAPFFGKAGDSPVSRLMVSKGSMELPTIPAGLAESTAAELQRFQKDKDPATTWSGVVAEEITRIGNVAKLRTEASALLEGSGSTEVLAARDAMIRQLRQNYAEKLFPASVTEGMLEDLIGRMQGDSGTTEFLEVFLAKLDHMRTVGATTLLDAMGIQVRDALQNFITASDTESRLQGFNQLESSIGSSLDVIRAINPAGMGVLNTESFVGPLRAIANQESGLYGEETDVQRQAAEGAKVLAETWQIGLKDMIESMTHNEQASLKKLLGTTKSLLSEPNSSATSIIERTIQANNLKRLQGQRSDYLSVLDGDIEAGGGRNATARFAGFDAFSQKYGLPDSGSFRTALKAARDSDDEMLAYLATRTQILDAQTDALVIAIDAARAAGQLSNASGLETILSGLRDRRDAVSSQRRGLGGDAYAIGAGSLQSIFQGGALPTNRYSAQLLGMQGLEASGVVGRMYGGSEFSAKFLPTLSGGNGGPMHHLQILKATLSETDALIERTETMRLGYETLGDVDGARVQAQKLKELLSVGSQLATQIEAITGKNADMVASFRNGFETIAEGWRSTATNFSNIGSSFATNIVDGLSGGFTDFAMNVKSADEALQEFGSNMMRMAIQMLSQKALQMVFGSVFGGIGGAVAGGISGGVSSSAGTWDMAGISATVATGGLLPGTPSRRDNMLIAAASGEFVIPATRVQQYGAETFEMYRQGRMPQGFASGGIIGGTGAVPSFSGGGGSGTSVTVNVNVADGEIKNSSATAIGKNAEQLGQTMKQMAERAMAEHRRQGGMFAGRRRR